MKPQHYITISRRQTQAETAQAVEFLCKTAAHALVMFCFEDCLEALEKALELVSRKMEIHEVSHTMSCLLLSSRGRAVDGPRLDTPLVLINSVVQYSGTLAQETRGRYCCSVTTVVYPVCSINSSIVCGTPHLKSSMLLVSHTQTRLGETVDPFGARGDDLNRFNIWCFTCSLNRVLRAASPSSTGRSSCGRALWLILALWFGHQPLYDV